VRYLFQFLRWLSDCERLDTDDCFCASDWDRFWLERYGFELPEGHCVALFNREGTETLSDKKRYIVEAYIVTEDNVIDLTFVNPPLMDLTSFLESLGLLRRKIYGYIVYRKPE